MQDWPVLTGVVTVLKNKNQLMHTEQLQWARHRAKSFMWISSSTSVITHKVDTMIIPIFKMGKPYLRFSA